MAQTMRKKIIITKTVIRQVGFYFYNAFLAKLFKEKGKKRKRNISYLLDF